MDAVRALLSSGVNPAVKDAQERTPYELAKSDTVKSAFIQETIQAISRAEYVLLHSGITMQLIWF